MDDQFDESKTLIEVPGKPFPAYDPFAWPSCHPIEENKVDVTEGGMQIGKLKIQPISIWLPDSPYYVERWKRAQEHFKEAGIYNLIDVPGTHGKRCGISGVHTYDRDNSGDGYRISAGYVSEWLNVYMLYNVCRLLPATHFLKLECDTKLIPDFVHHLASELENVPDDFDFLFAGSCCLEGKLTKHIKGNVYQLDQSTQFGNCGHCYILAKKAIPHILSTQRDSYAPSDLNLAIHTFPDLKVYAIAPRLAEQFDNNLPL